MKRGADLILSIQSDFLREARSAPELFRDLASLEQHIADSYRDRALVELLQNADDAQARRVGVFELGDCLVIANDGRYFSGDDVKALCRSGASEKTRGGKTIGFRGIGFKSVVNLAERVSVLSGDFAFFFDRSATETLLPDIPLIPLLRIPHWWDEGVSDISRLIPDSADRKFSTFFLFHGVKTAAVKEELLSLHRSTLLFLNNIVDLEVRTTYTSRHITVKNESSCGRTYKLLEDDPESEKWEIVTGPESLFDKLAFLCDGKHIVAAPLEESVIHSFTPTTEFSGAFLKMNGDFSTDPSRKHIVMDQISKCSFENCVALVVGAVVEAMEGRTIREGLFSLLLGSPLVDGGNKFRHLLIDGIRAQLNDTLLSSFNGRKVLASTIRLRPEWLNYDDYQKLCHDDLTFVHSSLLAQHPDLPAALGVLGYHKLFLKEAIQKVNSSKISLTGAAQLLSKLVSQYRYDLTQQNVSMLRELRVWAYNSDITSASEVESFDHLESRYQQYVRQNTDSKDLHFFLSKLGIHCAEPEGNEAASQEYKQVGHTDDTRSAEPSSMLAPRIPRWRTAEKMVEEYLSAVRDVVQVTDVSKSNVGYDLQVLFKNGVTWYVEVKSVSSFTDNIKLTNNEYASAHDKGNNYILAVITNKEPVEVRFLRDPVNHIAFVKQVEKFSWVSENYSPLLESIDKLTTM